MKKTTILLTALVFFMLPAFSAHALEYLEQDGFYIYYPVGAEQIAAGLQQKLPEMSAFLAGKGLPVATPLHILIDADNDMPEAFVHMTPHREIRIPLKAPGVMQEGFREPDPWAYFLFKGLCRQGIYALRGGLPAAGHYVFGEILSPNLIMPPWIDDGICDLLYQVYSGRSGMSPLDTAIFETSLPPDIAKVSNHPGVWPGYWGFRIYGRPFLAWLHRNYGWEAMLAFLDLHGRGVVPIEIDLKARKAFGKSWNALWEDFSASHPGDREVAGESLLITGYWPEPFTYWNLSGVTPGLKKTRLRGRYGYLDDDENLWISELDAEGISRITAYHGQIRSQIVIEHVMDPGPGRVAVYQNGADPELIILPEAAGIFESEKELLKKTERIPAPAGTVQLSGPVRHADGRIAVAANVGGNWDIWIFSQERGWQRITSAPSIEMDPWWEGDSLVLASDISGRFQIHAADLRQLTNAPYAAILPRRGRCLTLTPSGWQTNAYNAGGLKGLVAKTAPQAASQTAVPRDAKAYNPLPSILPNYIVPELYIGTSDVQLGFSTRSRDVSRDYSTDLGVRYSTDTQYTTLRVGGEAKDVGLRFSRYPISYNPRMAPRIEESRHEVQLYWEPEDIDVVNLNVSLNRQTYEPLNSDNVYYRVQYLPKDPDEPLEFWDREYDYWAAATLSKTYGDLSGWVTTEIYPGGQRSVYGGVNVLAGKDIFAVFHLEAGQTWGDTRQGHGTFRIGGDVGEGYFTKRTSRLFPLRGFKSNILEADQALTTGLEVYWPLANLQKGYKTLPLFLHRLRLGTFVDMGACRDHMSWDDLLVGAGFELVTSMEVAWGNLSHFRLGVAWPVKKPDYYPDWSAYNADDLDGEDGPRFILQLGKPL